MTFNRILGLLLGIALLAFVAVVIVTRLETRPEDITLNLQAKELAAKNPLTAQLVCVASGENGAQAASCRQATDTKIELQAALLSSAPACANQVKGRKILFTGQIEGKDFSRLLNNGSCASQDPYASELLLLLPLLRPIPKAKQRLQTR
jgi:hypothetical protein